MRRIPIIAVMLLLLVSCATQGTQEAYSPETTIEGRDMEARQAAVAVSLPETAPLPVPEDTFEEAVPIDAAESVEIPVPAETRDEEFGQTADISQPVSIIEEPEETVTVEEPAQPDMPLGDMVYAVNLAGEDEYTDIPVPEDVYNQALETVDIIPEPEAVEEIVDDIRPEDLVPYDVQVTPPEPWYRNILSFLSAYGVWIAILFAIFAVVVILIIIVVRRPDEKKEEVETRLVDEGPMEDETASKEIAMDADLARQAAISRVDDEADDFSVTQEIVGDDE